MQLIKQLKLTGTLLVFVSTSSCAQNDHLEPARNFNQYEGILKFYYNGISDLLGEGLSEKPLARYMVLPSFGAEYILSVEKDFSGQFKMVVRTTSQNFWYADNKKDVKIISNVKFIDTDLALKVKQLFDKVTQQIKPPEKNVEGADGVSYFFSAINDKEQLITGEIWSPDKKSKMGMLVQVCDELVSFTTSKAASSKFDTGKIDKLIAELQ